MKHDQRKYIDYVEKYAEANRHHIWLGGSFLHGNPTPFSDVDISVLMEKDTLREFICGYGEPVYISYTTNPEGIIIVIYEDGVAVDLEVIGSVEVTDNRFFHLEDIKAHGFVRNGSICREFCMRNDPPYQTARLFHRSLIKYLAGKKEAGVSVANEIAAFLGDSSRVKESDYKNGITSLIEQYHNKYPLDEKYHGICVELIEQVETVFEQ